MLRGAPGLFFCAAECLGDGSRGAEQLTDQFHVGHNDSPLGSVTSTGQALCRFIGEAMACPNDTNGDGDCGRRYCVFCGPKRDYSAPPPVPVESPLEALMSEADRPKPWENYQEKFTPVSKEELVKKMREAMLADPKNWSMSKVDDPANFEYGCEVSPAPHVVEGGGS